MRKKVPDFAVGAQNVEGWRHNKRSEHDRDEGCFAPRVDVDRQYPYNHQGVGQQVCHLCVHIFIHTYIRTHAHTHAHTHTHMKRHTQAGSLARAPSHLKKLEGHKPKREDCLPCDTGLARV